MNDRLVVVGPILFTRLRIFLLNFVLIRRIDIVRTVIGIPMHHFEATSRCLVDRIIDPVQLIHAQALADLNEQGGIEWLFRN